MPITTTSPLPNAIQLISCDFDKDFCGWNSNNKWMRTNGDFSKFFGRYGPESDWSSIIKSNCYVILKQNFH